MLAIQICPATADDLQAINDIYNHYVPCSTCTYQEEPETMDCRRGWFASHGPLHPITVATVGGDVVGWGSLSPFRERSAYRHTVENSVYVRHTHQRRGIGRGLLMDLIERASALGHHTIIAGIDAEQTGSILLHERLGFREVAYLPEVGFKFNRWLHVRYLQLML
ncbi:MAG TPA: GNAT family N-acetyltransferase [Tepidisphaeraceae bacterium]|nr:GNAT family N-acetyltransferase [Tepidisphaeraceae bacterium]